ncbi:MAG TPA: hypothetical protein VJ996_00280 [Solirubrobacteraceae bacterium]|jgi:hypothetical protein|nr:hypothetical protein [Solirubrobacteraceae bacterium]
MPRHIRSVTARRPRKIINNRPAKDAPRPAAATASPRELKLLDGLRRAFEAAAEARESPESSRDRYVQAMESLADYLEDIGADAVSIERIDELGWALEDLSDGVVAPLLTPTRAKRGATSLPGAPSAD